MPKDTYIHNIKIVDKIDNNDVYVLIHVSDDHIYIEDYSVDDSFEIPIEERITLGNICQYLMGFYIMERWWTENYFGTQLTEWGYDWEIEYYN